MANRVEVLSDKQNRRHFWTVRATITNSVICQSEEPHKCNKAQKVWLTHHITDPTQLWRCCFMRCCRIWDSYTRHHLGNLWPSSSLFTIRVLGRASVCRVRRGNPGDPTEVTPESSITSTKILDLKSFPPLTLRQPFFNWCFIFYSEKTSLGHPIVFLFKMFYSFTFLFLNKYVMFMLLNSYSP